MRSLFGSLHTPSSFSPLSGRPPGRNAGHRSGVWWLLCIAGGWLQAASLAWPIASWSLTGTPPGQPDGWLQIASLALLVLALQNSDRAGQALWRGWLFATVWLAGTFWWLFISLHTVKTHASHINSKLGVERRTQAVARAKALGLLG